MNKFKVGDIVCVKPWKDIKKGYFVNDDGSLEIGAKFFPEGMSGICGRKFEINSVKTGNKYTLRLVGTETVVVDENRRIYNFPEEILELIEAGKEEKPVRTFLKVEFTRVGRAVSVEILKAPPLAMLECFIKDEESREYYKENDAWCSSKGYDVILRDFTTLHCNALSIAYSDYEDHRVSTWTYETEMRARAAVQEFMKAIDMLNEKFNEKAEMTITD